MDSNSRVREIVKKIMQKNGISYDDMGMRAGLSGSTISNFISARKGLTLKSADAILGALGLEIGIRRKNGGARE